MKGPQVRVLRLFGPVRGVAQRFALPLLMILSVALIPYSRFDPEAVGNVRSVIVDAVVPILDVLSRPASAISHGVQSTRRLVYLYSEVRRLESENALLLKWQEAAHRLEAENSAFRSLLGVNQEHSSLVVTARVVADSSSLFVRTLLLNAGMREGVLKGQAVVNAEGLIGRIVETGEESSRVLQLVDLNSRVPIVISPTGQRGVLAGDNTDRPEIIFLANQNNLNMGDYVLTSGHGGVFPPGLRVGTISSATAGVVRVQLFVNWHRLEYVQVLSHRSDKASNSLLQN